ncbi:coagulation factor V-like, partial [Scleropages formosus]
AVERHYFIAAVKIKWDYGGQQHPRSDSSYEKVVYREYTAGFKQPKKHPSWAGLLGPTVRGEEGDVIVVTFRNMADREYSIHPHGIAYGKQSEGSLYFDNTSPFEQKDGKVLPEQEHTYYWEVTPEVAPKQSDPPCLTYSYLSHRDFIRDFNSGLIGTLMVCKKGSLNPAGEQIHFSKEYVLLFSVFDETKSWYLPKSTSSQNHVKYTINGYSNGTIPDLSMCAYTSVSWHLLGMSSEPEIFSVHFNGQVLQNTGHRLSSVGLISGTATSINVTAVHPGCWLLSSHATKHLEAGMHGFLNIQTCVGITPPRRRITIQEKRQSQEWTYYIAAEEIIWDYAPNIPDYIDSEYQSKYLKQGRDRIGKKYKKAVFVEYVNETFTVKKENKQRKMETGILGPVIRAQIRDVVKVVFKNKASRPYSIYPHGLTIDKDAEGTYYPEGGNQTHAVQPGQTYTYVWKVIDEDEPTDRDSRCLTRMYHTINGYVYDSGQNLMFCNGEIVTWHMSSVGAQDNIQTVTFYGHSFELNERVEDVLSLFPMTGETITMSMDNLGHWLLTSLNSHAKKGMRLNFKDVECYRDYYYEYSEPLIENKVPDAVSVWVPEDRDELKKRNKDPEPITKMRPPVVDESTDYWASQLGLRSFRNQSNGPIDDVELLDFSLLDIDQNLPASNKTENLSLSFSTLGNNVTDPESSSSQTKTQLTLTEGVALEEPNVTVGSFNESRIESNTRRLNENEDVENSSKENMTSSSENGGDVMIYLQDNSKEAIFTSSLDRPRKHWSYDGKHKIVQLEMTENMTRYIKEDSNSTVNKKKTEQKPKSKMKYKRRRPMKMYAVKTRKKKVYKPQPRSELSPRGFMPPALNPRGARPIFSEEDLTEKPVVIGVPRQDFNDYDIYIPTLNDDLDHIDIPDEHKGNEYEYVNYKDPYGKQTDEKARYFSQVTGENVRTYFIAAVEMEWDYEGYGQRRQERSDSKDGPTKFTKVIFRRYLDTTFTIPEIRGETDEHLGILGPIIKAEVDETIMVVFKNLAGRPYSLHAHGVSYSKQMEGLKYDDNSPHWYKLDNEVLPNESYTYIWKVEPKAGPKRHDSDCRMWPYYSGVNPEKDIHSGLVGPLLICREGTLNKELVDMREFILLFMSFDETKSWYYEKNLQRLEMKNKRAVVDPQLKDKLKFHAINGIIYSLKGLRMYTNQLVRWHVFNMGSSKDVQSIHFHGQTFVEKRENEYRQGVHLLLPGSFSTLEMWPSKPGLWLLESEVGEFQQKGMQTLFLIIDIDCAQPLGLISHSVKDSQITASHYTGEWKPHLARLHNIGKYNAWSTDRSSGDWIQVDFQRPVVISKVATQGAKQFISSHYVLNYTVSYRTDGKNWITYKTFSGNKNSYEVKENTFFPPLIGRYVRLYPLHSYNRPTIRMEFYGCELDGCSVPLGMEQRTIKDSQITASSSASNWLHGLWHPWLARLNNQGAVNAWQAKYNDMQQWLQVELKDVKKITGIVTQGAKSMGKEMYVMSYIIQYSDDGKIWKTYNEDNEYGHPKVFVGNTDNNDHAKNYIYPPIFSKFIRIVPQRWERAITMRIELLG